jgi:hypothetical protein
MLLWQRSSLLLRKGCRYIDCYQWAHPPLEPRHIHCLTVVSLFFCSVNWKGLLLPWKRRLLLSLMQQWQLKIRQSR